MICPCLNVKPTTSSVRPNFWSFERKTYTWSSPKSSHSWNPWNLADFTMKSMKSGGFQVKSTQNLIKSDVSTKTLQLGGGGCRERGYDPRFHEIQGYSPSPAFIKLNSFCWNIWFYKVLGGFHVKSKDHLQGIVTLCLFIYFSQRKDSLFLMPLNC